MEEWLKIAGAVIAFCSLWWKITSSMAQMATKADLAALKVSIEALRQELKADAAALQEGLSKEIRQLRELLFVHVSDHEKHRKSE